MDAGRGVSLAGADAALVVRRAPGGGGRSPGLGGGGGRVDAGAMLADRELQDIERDYPEGLTSVQIVDIFTQRGIRFSEATFRKYVQQGLLARSRRVGRKGKHQGSLGLYPASTVRRINTLKRLMAENFTIEEIQNQFLRFCEEMDTLERGLDATFAAFAEAARSPLLEAQARRDIGREITAAKQVADDLLERLRQLERRLSEPHERPAGKGAPGGAEDLL